MYRKFYVGGLIQIQLGYSFKYQLIFLFQNIMEGKFSVIWIVIEPMFVSKRGPW